jgi:hypothetical protein
MRNLQRKRLDAKLENRKKGITAEILTLSTQQETKKKAQLRLAKKGLKLEERTKKNKDIMEKNSRRIESFNNRRLSSTR